jgi:multiple sugar transport system permease protein
MATTTVPAIREGIKARPLAASGRNSKRREALLGLLFVAPVMIVTLIFEIFPVIYGFYISLQDQKGVLPDGFIGLANFQRAVGSFAYVIPLVVAVILVLVSVRFLITGLAAQRDGKGNFTLYLGPGLIVGGATLAFSIIAFRFGLEYTAIPFIVLVVGIGLYYALNNATRSRAPGTPSVSSSFMLRSWAIGLFSLGAIVLTVFTFTELYNSSSSLYDVLPLFFQGATDVPVVILPLIPQFVALFGTVVAVGLVLLFNRLRERIDAEENARLYALIGFARALLVILIIILVSFVLIAQSTLLDSVNRFRAIPADTLRARALELRPQFTVDQRLAFSASRQAETARRMLAWSELYTIVLGVGFVFLAYYIWDSAKRRSTTPGMLVTLLAAICLMVGGYFFIGVLPDALSSGDTLYYDSLIRTVTYAIATVPVQLALGLALAYLLFHEIKRGKTIYRLIFFMPYIAPTVATAAVFAMIFSSSPISPANQVAKSLGLPPQEWLQTTKGIFEIIVNQIAPGTVLPNYLIGPSLPLLSAILYAIWVFSGYNAVVFMAGLGNVPKEIYEAAQVDGAGRWTTFRRIVFPLISPTTYFLTLLAIIGTFRAFTHIWVLRSDARGGIDTAMIYIYETIQYPAPPNKTQSYAAALSFLLFGIILILTVIQNRYSRDRVFYS